MGSSTVRMTHAIAVPRSPGARSFHATGLIKELLRMIVGMSEAKVLTSPRLRLRLAIMSALVLAFGALVGPRPDRRPLLTRRALFVTGEAQTIPEPLHETAATDLSIAPQISSARAAPVVVPAKRVQPVVCRAAA
jgi:hypothetical protein